MARDRAFRDKFDSFSIGEECSKHRDWSCGGTIRGTVSSQICKLFNNGGRGGFRVGELGKIYITVRYKEGEGARVWLV